MGLLATLLLNSALGLAAYGVARHGFRQPPGLTRTLAAIVLAWTWATVGMELLGSLGWMSLGTLLLWVGLGLVIAFAVRSADRRRAEATIPDETRERWGWSGTLAIGLVLWVTILLGIPALFLPVKVVSDGPIYHLYFAARWWKEGRLSLIAAPFGENAASYFPAVGDLWFTWLMTSWGGERLAKVGQIPFLLTSALASFAIARRLGASCSSAVVAVAWFVTSSPLLLFSFESNVDTIFTAGYLLAAFFFLRYALDDPSRSTLALGGLAAGGALGSKAIGVVFIPILIAMASALIFIKNRRSLVRVQHLIVLGITPMVMAGFWYGRNLWLTGNPLYPLHVAPGGHVLLSGWYDSSVMKSSPYYIPLGEWRAMLDTFLAVMDPRLVPFWGLALLGAWSWGRSRGADARPSWVWACSALAVLNFALYWVLIPYRTQQRFMLHAIGLAAVPLALLLDRSRFLRGLAVALLAIHLGTSQGWPFSGQAREPLWDLSAYIPNRIPGLIPLESLLEPFLSGGDVARPVRGGNVAAQKTAAMLSALVTLSLALGALVAAWLWSRVQTLRQSSRLLVAVGFTFGLIAGAWAYLVPMSADSRLLFYPPFRDYYLGWLDLESRAGASGTRIAYSGTDLPFYLLGVGLRNEVRYVNVDAHRGWLLHDYHREAVARKEGTWPNSRPGWDRIHPDYDAWLENLKAEQIRLLVVTQANPAEGSHNIADQEGFPIERVWADAHPEVFEPVYGVAERDPKMRIYRLRSGLRNS